MGHLKVTHIRSSEIISQPLRLLYVRNGKSCISGEKNRTWFRFEVHHLGAFWHV